LTRDQFITFVSPLLRHGLTVIAGVLAAKGYLSSASEFDAYAIPVVLGLATIAWSMLEKSALLSRTIAALPTGDIGLLAAALTKFNAQGASPLMVAHTAQVLASVAVNEAQAAMPAPEPVMAPVYAEPVPQPLPEPVPQREPQVTVNTLYGPVPAETMGDLS
jgi:hypothetical protein